MIYLDTSVALAELFAEDRRPPDALWREPLVSSRLLEYELWTRVNARGAAGTHGEAVRDLLARVSLVELAPSVLARALEPFPAPIRTLDALHLATVSFLVSRRQPLALATYDDRMRACAERMGVALAGA
jgi:predicted nucleic acid-binding protein